MKTKLKFMQFLMMLILSTTTLGVWADNQNLTQTVCVGSQPYYVDLSSISGATYNWSVSGGGTITAGIGTRTITINWTTPGGPYTVSVYTSANGCDGPPQSVSVTVTDNPSATIAYTGNPFCKTSAPVSVTQTGTTGGTYTAPAGLTIDAVTGTITPGTSTSGTYLVTYFITGTIYCSSFTTTTSVTITTAPAATISYAGSPFCTSVATPQAVTLTGTIGGTYSAPVGLTINASTGAITPSTSTAGTYTVTYTIDASGGCSAVTATASVTINTAPTATISYAGSPFCFSISTPQPVTLTGTIGGTYSAPAGLTINASTGAIIPNTSTIGTYTVTYTIAASGGCPEITATTSVTITTAPAASISYAGSPFCTSVATPQPVTLTGTAGGIYSSTVGLTIDATTGTVTPSTSTAGTYTVTYTIASSGGCSGITAIASVTVNTTPATSPIWHN
jgi:hypothetical protein